MLINKLVHYINTSDNKYKYDIAQIIVVLVVLPINYIIFYYIIQTDFVWGIVLFSIGSGRLLTAWIMERHNCYFGKGYVPFLRYMSYSALLLVTFIALFMLLKDAKENRTPALRLIEKEQKQNPPMPTQTTAPHEANKTINPKVPYAPSSWLIKNKE
jgi:hypothetical protein